jgi:hypothetical protein
MDNIQQLQTIVDQMKQEPAYRQYVAQRKLGLLDSKLETIDRMLEAGILK